MATTGVLLAQLCPLQRLQNQPAAGEGGGAALWACCRAAWAWLVRPTPWMTPRGGQGGRGVAVENASSAQANAEADERGWAPHFLSVHFLILYQKLDHYLSLLK